MISKKCYICNGNYPISKHNFDECYSLDFEWDLNHGHLNQSSPRRIRKVRPKSW